MMPADKRHHFLDAGNSDDDVPDYQSDDDLRKGGPIAKRQKCEDEDEDLQSEDDEAASSDRLRPHREEHGAETEAQDEASTAARKQSEKEDSRSGKDPNDLPGVSKPLTQKNLVATEAAVRRSGVVYLSRIPPFMKPQKLRSLLEPHGAINRIFLSPEDPLEHSRRVRNGGNKKKMYADGWVEFIKKKDAKKAVDLLNARTIGGKKGSYYHDDIWNMLYLKGFKWHNLTEQISAEAAERASRMRAEISRSTKENKDFVRNVEKAKMLDNMHAKKAAKREGDDETGDTGLRSTKRRKFEQAKLAKKESKIPKDAQRVSQMLFS